MISYADKTFCNGYLICKKWYKCPDCFTPQIKDLAQKWAKDAGLDDVPVSLCDAVGRDCFVPFFGGDDVHH